MNGPRWECVLLVTATWGSLLSYSRCVWCVLCVCVCVCVCVCAGLCGLWGQICLITWVWQRYYNLKVFYEDTAYVPVIQKA